MDREQENFEDLRADDLLNDGASPRDNPRTLADLPDSPENLENLDLLGFPITEPPRRPRSVRAHPAPMGSGPDGLTCRQCRHLLKRASGGKRFFKCARAWNGRGNPSTDVRLKDAACSHFEPAVPADPA